MLIPLEQFVCDTCGQIINSPKEGWLEWISKYDKETGKRETHSFRIVHHYLASPLSSTDDVGCYQHNGQSGRKDLHLDDFLEENHKMAYILKFLDMGSIHDPDFRGTELTDIRQYVETVRRLTIPYYEEARLYWDRAREDGYFESANEIWVYAVGNLKRLIETYGG